MAEYSLVRVGDEWKLEIKRMFGLGEKVGRVQVVSLVAETQKYTDAATETLARIERREMSSAKETYQAYESLYMAAVRSGMPSTRPPTNPTAAVTDGVGVRSNR